MSLILRSISPSPGHVALPWLRARFPAPRSRGRSVNSSWSSLASCWLCHKFADFLEFYQVRERLFEPLALFCAAGQGTSMSGVTFNRNRVKLKKLLGIRARLALLAVILVAPLMLERARSLEDTRARQIAQASEEFSNLARHSADAQREVISSVETMLKSAAYIRASAGGVSRSCDLLRASLPHNLPWIHNLLIADGDGRVQCSTNNTLIGVNLGDRAYLKKAASSRDIVFSDFLLAKSTNSPIVMAAYPVSAINPESDSVILAAVSLDWMSKILGNLSGRPGVSAALIDSTGTIM